MADGGLSGGSTSSVVTPSIIRRRDRLNFGTTNEEFSDLLLTVQWRSINAFDNSGVFIRFPSLGNADPAQDWQLAVNQGYEIQIDDRGSTRIPTQREAQST